VATGLRAFRSCSAANSTGNSQQVATVSLDHWLVPEQSAAELPTVDYLVALIGDLQATWRSRTSLEVRIEDDTTLTRFGVAYGLTAHVHRIAAVAVPLLADGVVLEAVPLVRMAYETALTAVWCVQIQGAPIALANKHVRQRKAPIRTLGESRSLAAIAAKMREEQPLPARDEETADDRFEGICMALEPGGQDAYAHFRLMSSMAHPSAFLCDFYLADDATVPFTGYRLRDEPEQPKAGPYLAMLAASLIWSGRAMDYLDKNHPRRSQLRDAARRLGIESELQPSDPSAARKRPR
jgi:hypothetical protein